MKDDQIYIIEEQIFFRNDTVKMWPDNVMHIDEYVNELNRKIGEEFKRFYDNLPVKDFAESAVQNMINDILQRFSGHPKSNEKIFVMTEDLAVMLRSTKKRQLNIFVELLIIKKYTEKRILNP